MTWAGRRGTDGALARLLAGAIDRGGIDGILLDIGAALAAVEDIVGRDMDQGRPDGLAGLGQRRRPIAIDGEGELGLALGLVDGGIGGGVDHQIGLLGDRPLRGPPRAVPDRSGRARARRRRCRRASLPRSAPWRAARRADHQDALHRRLSRPDPAARRHSGPAWRPATNGRCRDTSAPWPRGRSRRSSAAPSRARAGLGPHRWHSAGRGRAGR